MGSLKLHVTLDYEVWGNGSGCVHKCMIEPTYELVDLLEQRDIRLTIFVDMCEYWAFKECEEKGKFQNKDYKPATAIRNQLKNLLLRGHDIQLHFHPQWLRYKIQDDYTFTVDESLWRISSLKPGSAESELSLEWIFKKGVEDLEKMLHEVNPEYRCDKFRAGAWSIQPEEAVLKAMSDAGISEDYTVAPSMMLNTSLTRYDFRKSPEKLSWIIKNNLLEEDNNGGIIEYPIFTIKYSLLDKIKFYLKRKKVPVANANGCVKTVDKGLIGKMSSFRRLLMQDYFMFDVTSRMSLDELVHIWRSAEQRYSRHLKKGDVEIIAIGHPKNFQKNTDLTNFINQLP